MFKSSYDPLSNVFRLDYLKLKSKNQVPTGSFWKTMISKNTLKKDARKKLVADAYL